MLAITDGQTIVTLPPAQDHKPAYDGDTGPNTGGMGAYCPAPLVDEPMLHWIEEHVLVPTVHAMKRSRRPFRGVLYAGLMITKQGPKVLEYNVRFGDPECQPLLMRLKSDLVDVLEATVDGRLDEIEPLEVGPAAGGVRGDGQPRAIRAATRRASRSAAWTTRPGCPTSRSSTPAPRSGDGQVVTRRRPRAGRDRAGRLDLPRPSCRPTRRSSASAGRAPGAARTSPTRPLPPLTANRLDDSRVFLR